MKVYPILGRTTFLFVFLFPLFVSSQSTSQVYINEINYRAVKPLENIDFVEIYNAGPVTVNLSGWFLTGGLKYTFPNGTSIPAGAYHVVAADPALIQSEFGITGVLGPWEGKLASSDDKVVLRSKDYEVIDRVEYENWKEWPNVRYLDTDTTKVAASIQKLNPILNGQHPGSWLSTVPTPKMQNTGIYQAVATDIPVLKNVKKSPDKPSSTEEVIIKADFADTEYYANGMTVTVEYQINEAGSYTTKSEMDSVMWLTMPMLDNGDGADSTANNGLYTAVLPSQNHRTLVRYRIKVNHNGTDRYFPDPHHRENNYSYFVYNGHAGFGGFSFADVDTINEFMVVTNEGIPSSGSSGDYNKEATLIYNGKIYDHIQFRGRGKSTRPKPNFKFKFNSEKKLTLTDNCGKDYKVKKSKISLSGGYVNDPAGHGFTETFIYKILELVGALPRTADYTQLRFIDNAIETGVAGDFWGLYVMLEDYNSEDYFEQHGLATGNIWGHKPDTIKHEGAFPFADTIGRSSDTGPFDWDLVTADRVANIIYGQNARNYYGKHSHTDYYNSETGLWHTWWGDMDNAFGSPTDDTNWFSRANSTVDTVCGNVLYPIDSIQYKNELRSAYDLLLNTEQANFLVDEESKEIFNPTNVDNWTDIDDGRWGTLVTNYYDNNTMNNQLIWYKTWLSEIAAVILGRDVDGILDPDIPNRPTISLSGSTALNNIKLTNSSFTDPQGNGSFAAMEWRVGEWSDPANPYYDTKCSPKYEIETKWRSGELITFSSTFQVPVEANLKEGRTYKIRVRYKDNTGRWSHWSNPQEVVPTAAPSVNSTLVINEIMYNPAQRYTEFIEIHNTGSTSVSLTNIKLTAGVDYDFPDGQLIMADEYIVLAEDSCEFYNIHGFYPFGEYKSSLSNGGEYIELSGPYRTILDSLTFEDGNPWPGTADNGYYSLAFKEDLDDNSIGGNWGIQSLIQTPGVKNEFNTLGQHQYSGIVINEIHYNPFDSIDANSGEIISGKNFEFIEIKNISSSNINLSGAFFSRGIDYYFPAGSIIIPGQFIVLAEDKSSFEDRYNFAPFDKYDGKLSDTGETIWLNDKNGVLLDALTYSSSFPWDSGANGGSEDYSLALIDGTYNNETRLNWKTQCSALWTPGAENDFSCFTGLDYPGLVINEIHYDPIGGSSLEFIELVNSSNASMELEAVNFSSGVSLVFDQQFLPGAVAYPANYIVIANDSAAYHNAYQQAPDAVFTGSLSNFGEKLVLEDLFGVIIDEVTYDNIAPWNTEPSLGIKSLALIDPSMDNSLASSWCVQDINISPKAMNSIADTDNDSIIDCLDTCPSFNNSLIGTACDDGDPCTTGETYDSSCACSGGNFQDADNDGVCDADDDCPSFNNALIGTACDDDDPCTSGETFNASCDCAGGTIQDADNDGVCDADDTCPGFNNALIGTPCNDGDPCTRGATYDSSCGCSGGSFHDTDNDGVCNADDICPRFDDALIGTACDDGDPCTIGELYNTSCACAGGIFQDSDSDGVCDANEDECTSLEFEDFESGAGSWQSGGSDAIYIPNSIHSPSGQGSFLIRDNSDAASSISSQAIDLSQVGTARLQFKFKARNLSAGEDFYLQLSTNGGSSFQTVQTWAAGTDFSNNIIYQEQLFLSSNSSNTVLRFICDAGINSDEVYIDNIRVEDCPECVVSLIESNNSQIDESVYVQEMIETNGVVPVGAEINYVAEDYILMSQGFQVELGSVYHAYISPCN